jgi:hypothetical protein
VKEDAFKGGSPAKRSLMERWLRNPWKPAAGRLFPERES